MISEAKPFHAMQMLMITRPRPRDGGDDGTENCRAGGRVLFMSHFRSPQPPRRAPITEHKTRRFGNAIKIERNGIGEAAAEAAQKVDKF